MSAPLAGRTVVLGVTGGIAVYKACEVVSRLKKLGADVRVILTENAARFVPSLTFQTLSGAPVADGMFDVPVQWDIKHISWAKAADVFLVAPATANLLGKYANGIADDMLTTTLMATRALVLLAPAMNVNMWRHPATQQNLETLRARGVKTIGPGSGFLACGDIDEGRMAEPVEIVDAVLACLASTQDLAGRHVLVTAGPTREPLDPVRYLTNHSSGKMGYAIAEAAAMRGAQVTLVTGPVSLTPPTGVTAVPIETTQQLYDAMMLHSPAHDIIIQAAAPADYRTQPAPHKLKKTADEPLVLTLEQTPDVAAAIGRIKKPGQYIVAFAAETQHLIESARRKLQTKNADLIVANDVTQEGAGFAVDTNIATFVTKTDALALPQMPKRALADAILDAAIGKDVSHGTDTP